MLLHLEIVADDIEIKPIVIGPDLAAQAAVSTDELERIGAERLGQDDRRSPEFLIGEDYCRRRSFREGCRAPDRFVISGPGSLPCRMSSLICGKMPNRGSISVDVDRSLSSRACAIRPGTDRRLACR